MSLLDLAGLSVTSHSRLNSPFLDCVVLVVEGRGRESNTNHAAAAAAAKSLQSCPTLCDPIDGSPPGSPPLGFSRQEHWSGLPFPSPMQERKSESEVMQLCPTLATPWTAAHQAPPSAGFSRREHWSG